MSASAQCPAPPALGSRARIIDPDSRWHGEIGTVLAIYPERASSHLVGLDGGWATVYGPECLEEVQHK